MHLARAAFCRRIAKPQLARCRDKRTALATARPRHREDSLLLTPNSGASASAGRIWACGKCTPQARSPLGASCTPYEKA